MIETDKDENQLWVKAVSKLVERIDTVDEGWVVGYWDTEGRALSRRPKSGRLDLFCGGNVTDIVVLDTNGNEYVGPLLLYTEAGSVDLRCAESKASFLKDLSSIYQINLPYIEYGGIPLCHFNIVRLHGDFNDNVIYATKCRYINTLYKDGTMHWLY